MSASILWHFAPLKDPRTGRNKLHELVKIVLLTIRGHPHRRLKITRGFGMTCLG